MRNDPQIDGATARERIYETFTDRDQNVESAVADGLVVGTERLGLSIGFFSRIDDGEQVIVRSIGEHPLLQPGETCPIEAAYCRRTVELDGLLSVQDAAVSTAISENAYETFELGAYIGCKVLVDGEVYGTVCFGDEQPRETAFSEAEELFVELLARLTGQALEKQQYAQELETRNERLDAERERFRGIAETSFDALFRLDRDMTVTYVSAAIERVLGYDRASVVGVPLDRFIAPEAVETVARLHRRLMDGETVELQEVQFHDAADDPVTLEINARPITEDGTVTGVQGVARDVTDRQAREEALRIRTRAMDEAEIGITITTVNGAGASITYVNDAFERLTGYDASQADDAEFRFLHGPATDPKTVERIGEHVERGETVTVEMITYTSDGRPFWNRMTATPITDATGAVTHVLGFHDDVTDRKRGEKLLERLNRVLRHNLRNDMTVLLGQSDRLRGSEAGAAVADELESIVGDVLELAEGARRLERLARQPWEPERLDPATVVAEAVADPLDRHPEATLTHEIATDREICAGAETRIAVAELVENALEHDDDPPTQVTITARDDGEWIELTVADDGPGVPDLETDVIASGEETPLAHGRGLGLWLVNWIVTRYGGSFQLRSGDGDPPGTVATMRLPGIEHEAPLEAACKRPTTLGR